MSQYTDKFDNPIDVGSVVTYTTLRYQSAHQGFAVVEDFVPLVEKPSGGQWHSTGPNSRIPYIRKDQERKQQPTEFHVSHDDKGRPRPDKLYVARTRELRHVGGGRFKRLETSTRLGTRVPSDLIALDAVVKGIIEPDDV